MSRRVARPYAAALFEVLKQDEIKTLRTAEHQLAAAAAVLAGEPDLLRVFEVPSVTPAKKRELVTVLADKLGAAPQVSRLLQIMAEHVRLRLLPDVVTTFRGMIDRREGVVRGRVETATALTEPQREALVAALSAVAGGRVELEAAVRPAILAGFVIRVGSQVFDGSLVAQLRRFASAAAARS